MEGLTVVDGTIQLAASDAMTALDGLSAPVSIGGDLNIWRHAALTELDLESLTTLGGRLSVMSNHRLPTCEATSLRDQLVDHAGRVCILDNRADSCREDWGGCGGG